VHEIQEDLRLEDVDNGVPELRHGLVDDLSKTAAADITGASLSLHVDRDAELVDGAGLAEAEGLGSCVRVVDCTDDVCEVAHVLAKALVGEAKRQVEETRIGGLALRKHDQCCGQAAPSKRVIGGTSHD
jgi:hypothetical protein